MASRLLAKVSLVPALQRKKCHPSQFILTDRPGRLKLSSFPSALHIPDSEHVPRAVGDVSVSFFAYFVPQSPGLEYPGAGARLPGATG